MLSGRSGAGTIAGGVSLLHTAKWGIVPLDGAPDGSEVSFIPESSRCQPRPQGKAVLSTFQAVAAGGRVGVSLPRAGRYIACLQDGRALSTVVKVVDVPPRLAAFGCEQFGSLCPPRGAGVLSPHDVQFARSRRLKLFVYRDLPASFHDKIIQDGLPPEVRRGQVCDFFSAPCSPSGKPALMRRLENWFTTMKNVPDAPLLTKLLALASVPGVGTLDPSEASVFVVPFLGGFVEHDAPAATRRLDAEPQAHNLMGRLLARLPHMAAHPERHLFLLTHSCGQCHRKPCAHCAAWHRANHSAVVRLAATLGPRWHSQRTPLTQLVVPPLFMHEEFHHRSYVPLCAARGDATPPVGAAGTPLCRANTARRQLLLFYQGAHVAGNDIRNEVLKELSIAAFGGGLDDNSASTSCSCAVDPTCCVNASSGVAFFHTRSHWHPQLPLSHSQTATWMQRSTFCVCPGGDVTYNQRYFLALLAGCVPVIFGFAPTETAGRVRGGVSGVRGGVSGPPAVSWWKPKGPSNEGINPFAAEIDHSELVVEFPRAQIRGFIERLRSVPPEVVEAKQRAIERVRHKLLYDPTGARPDAFSMMLRELVRVLPPQPGIGKQPSEVPRRRRRALAVDT